ncbi:hypothetical protein HXX76_010883 [Chlamydomonas incerta]|uniref:Leucine-rich repeat-containing N-terminal plant-type domain-containing protein n=1 Tax=Chlamydomonas incerta TaxID=51695 RepID=A0A835SHM5_CHLIN|nr:hypothetical protein HXX76_010883 [Chlamydomonas incerta]|eukprot:KAG2427164.1 hypothetical protein HXX76_010883 [Chlamydomonas incerta]
MVPVEATTLQHYNSLTAGALTPGVIARGLPGACGVAGRDATANDALVNFIKPQLLAATPSPTCNLATWGTGGLACASANVTWTGVTCSQALINATGEYWVVSRLNLMNCGFQGAFPPDVSRLKALADLMLLGNSLNGTFPSGLSALTGLTSLELTGNQLSGSLGAALDTLSGLQLLRAMGNANLRGLLPSAWGTALRALTYLDLQGTQVGLPPLGTPYDPATLQSLPPAWTGLTRLGSLLLASASLYGTLPDAYGTALRGALTGNVYLDNNNLRGGLPPSWYNMTLYTFRVYSNPLLYGSIPAQYGSGALAASLSTFDVTGTGVCGAVPAGDAAANDALVNFIKPQLLAATPSPACNLATWGTGGLACASANVTWTGVTCTLAASNGTGIYWVVSQLSLLNCGFQGTFPPDITRLAALVDLNLAGNSLNGTFPSGLSALTGLTSLELSGNQLSGSLGAALDTLTNLVFLRAMGNANLRGPLPSAWGTALLALTYLDLQGTQVGLPPLGTPYDPATLQSLPDAYAALTGLASLALTSAALHGTIPDPWATAAGLQSVALSGNALRGGLPPSWSGLPLPVLEVYDNPALYGPIPSTWGTKTLWKYLTALNVSGTGVCGTIPSGEGAGGGGVRG